VPKALGPRAVGGRGCRAVGHVSPELHGRAVPRRGAEAQWGGRRRSCRGPGRDEAGRLIAGGGKGGGRAARRGSGAAAARDGEGGRRAALRRGRTGDRRRRRRRGDGGRAGGGANRKCRKCETSEREKVG
jgi:hypothetical protein